MYTLFEASPDLGERRATEGAGKGDGATRGSRGLKVETREVQGLLFWMFRWGFKVSSGTV